MEKTSSKVGLALGVIVVILVVTGFVVYTLQASSNNTGIDQSQSSEIPDSNVTSEEAAPNPSERMTITFTDAGFQPRDLTVTKGTVITVKNESSKQVEFSSDDHPTHRDNTEMNLKVLAPGEADSFTASQAGEWSYHDHIDDSLTGTIKVTE